MQRNLPGGSTRRRASSVTSHQGDTLLLSVLTAESCLHVQIALSVITRELATASRSTTVSRISCLLVHRMEVSLSL